MLGVMHTCLVRIISWDLVTAVVDLLCMFTAWWSGNVTLCICLFSMSYFAYIISICLPQSYTWFRILIAFVHCLHFHMRRLSLLFRQRFRPFAAWHAPGLSSHMIYEQRPRGICSGQACKKRCKLLFRLRWVQRGLDAFASQCVSCDIKANFEGWIWSIWITLVYWFGWIQAASRQGRDRLESCPGRMNMRVQINRSTMKQTSFLPGIAVAGI